MFIPKECEGNLDDMTSTTHLIINSPLGMLYGTQHSQSLIHQGECHWAHIDNFGMGFVEKLLDQLELLTHTTIR